MTLRTHDLQKAHQVSDHIVERVRARVPRVERISVHCEPQVRTHLRLALPLANRSGGISDHFGEAPFFALVVLRVSDRDPALLRSLEEIGIDVGHTLTATGRGAVQIDGGPTIELPPAAAQAVWLTA